jgi:MFS family permease
MPFLPFVLLLAWQAISRSASFALGWATALYFGQVPGKQGRVLAVISLLAAAWVILLAGFAAPLLAGALLDALGIIGRNFAVRPLVVLAIAAGLLLTPPLIAALTTWVEFHEERSVGQWLRLVPSSYPATASLGVAVLQMVILTPFVLVQRIRRKRTLLQVALSMKPGADDEAMTEIVAGALRTIGVRRLHARRARGIERWPMRTVGFAVQHLLGAVVRGEPMYLQADGLQIYAYATNVAVLGPMRTVHLARAALEREAPFLGAHLTWSEDSQRLEDAIVGAGEQDGGMVAMRRRLDDIQARIDAASLNVDEWNVLSRLRLEVEVRAAADANRRRRVSA